MSLSALPEGCVRGRCWCSWWIATPAQVRKNGGITCRACGVPVRKAEQKDFDAVGVSTKVELVEKKAPKKAGKRRNRFQGMDGQNSWPEGT